MYLSMQHCVDLEECRRASLRCYGALSSACAQHNILHYVTKSKRHMWDHAIRTACKEQRNPAYSWCFRDDRFLAKIAKIGRSLQGGATLEYKVMQLWLVQKALDKD